MSKLEWTISRNDAMTTKFVTVYTLYWRGLVRGQLMGYEAATTIRDTLNAHRIAAGYVL